MSPYIFVPLLLLLAGAVLTDLKSRMIYDWLTLPGIVYFFAAHTVLHDLGPAQFAGGAAGLGGISLLLAMLSGGRFGGGDIKLFAMIGAGLGWSAGIWVFLFTFPLAALIALPTLLIAKWLPNIHERMKEFPMAPFISISAVLVLWTLESC